MISCFYFFETQLFALKKYFEENMMIMQYLRIKGLEAILKSPLFK